MSVEENISSFKTWLSSLNYRTEDMPSHEALKSVFTSPQSILFVDMMKRVRPRDEVSEIRKNILLSKMDKLKDLVIPSCPEYRRTLPTEFQRLLKIKSLKKRKIELETELDQLRTDCDSHANFIKSKNIQKINLQKNCEQLESRVNILELKSESLDRNINNEKMLKEKMLAYMPVKSLSSKDSSNRAINAIGDALKELEDFYQVFFKNSEVSNIRNITEELWMKLRSIFKNIPNYLLWNVLLKLKEEQLQNVMALSKSSLDENQNLFDKKLTAFDLQSMKTESLAISTFVKSSKAKKIGNELSKEFSSRYYDFIEAAKVNLDYHNGDLEEIEKIISDYIVAYTTRSYSKAQCDFFVKEINDCKTRIKKANELETEHYNLLGCIKNIYNETESYVQRIEHDMAQMNHIKSKIMYVKNNLDYMLKAIQKTKSTMKITRGRMFSATESFNISDSAFCSTKLDLDSTADASLRMDSKIANSTNLSKTNPSHFLEFQIFMETPMEKLNMLEKNCNMYLSANPFILENPESPSAIQLAPGALLTPEGVLEEVEHKSKRALKLQQLAKDLPVDISLVKIDENILKSKKNELNEQITELLDSINGIDESVSQTLKKCSRIYEFVLKNPLKKYIPNSRLVNDHNYSDYELEYLMYYRMAHGNEISH